jgi:non-homologous end joining protein Ku
MSLYSSKSRARNAPFVLLPENLASTEKLNIIFEKVFGKIFKDNKAILLKVLDKALIGRQLRFDVETEIQ